MRTQNWHEVQDSQITAYLKDMGIIYNHPSPVRRVWGLLGCLIMEKHIWNILFCRKKDEYFKLLDIGCGNGELIHRLADFYPNASFTGIDTNTSSIELASEKQRVNCKFVISDFEKAKFLDKQDIIICSEVIEHVEDLQILLDILAERLDYDGILSISTPSGWMYRTPHLYNCYKILTTPKKFYRLYLKPENNWKEAVRIHPSIHPSKLINMLERRGLKLISRQSSLWWLPEWSMAYAFFKWYEKKAGLHAAQLLFHFINFLEAAMNLLPPLRIFESRFVLMLRKVEK